MLVSFKKISSWVCLVQPGLNNIFHWHVQSCIFNKSLLSVEADVFAHFKIENKCSQQKV